MNWRTGWPFCDSRGAASSGRVTMPPVHKFGWPERHCGQLPQNPDRQATTWSPGLTVVTSAPTASTMPAPSWPSTIGRSSGNRPIAVDHVQVAVADPGRRRADQHLAPPRLVDLHRLDRQRLVHLAKDGGLDLHRFLPHPVEFLSFILGGAVMAAALLMPLIAPRRRVDRLGEPDGAERAALRSAGASP